LKTEYLTVSGRDGFFFVDIGEHLVPEGFRVAFLTRVALKSGNPEFANFGFFGIPGSEENRRCICEALGLDFEMLTLGEQVHSANVAFVEEHDAGSGHASPDDRIPQTDAMVTSVPGGALGICTADCVPIMIADPANRAVCAVHAGWRGTVSGIVGKSIDAMQKRFGSEPECLLAYIGPSAGPCCYEVREDLIGKLDPEDTAFIEEREGLKFLDLWKWNESKLVGAGLKENNIWNAGLCTCCSAGMFFSHRCDKNVRGLNLSLIAVKT